MLIEPASNTKGLAPEPEFAPPWDDAPEWAMWVGESPSGTLFWYDECPIRNDRWCPWGAQEQLICRINKNNPNWRDTLQQRPEPEPEPCPFCGCPWEIRKHPHDGPNDSTMFSAECKGCGIQTIEHTSRQHLADALSKRA